MLRVQIRAPKLLKLPTAAAALVAVCATIGLSQQLLAQDYIFNPSPIVHSSGPILAASGERILLCAANNYPVAAPAPTTTAAISSNTSSASLNVALQVLNGITGAVLAQTQVAVPPLGSTATPPDPCLSFTVASATLAASPLNLFVVRVALNPQPLPPGLCAYLGISLQVFTPEVSGSPSNIRAINFEPPDPCSRAPLAALNHTSQPGQLALLDNSRPSTRKSAR